ncbi:hypothetical protein TI10_18305 [Photorhabdus luminescens subsp. luminescens]|uniref:hypothetical protein n=1 Tax=Photorhabdus TaxID=29487 RepID=UPI00066D230E|nr:hypothetical protein [Photorhabdus luminescens]KMW72043.1 hypothetical protein TI10_18305 [Photorhabdus luminescens subsp. luminescens]
MGQAGIAAASGVAGGISKAGAKDGGDVGNMKEFLTQSGFGTQIKIVHKKPAKYIRGRVFTKLIIILKKRLAIS